ncbi:MAG: hypothetical protein IKQ41_04280 [Clostridia bacterium]|nr:hypothetical protein [Clostridia bacterium]
MEGKNPLRGFIANALLIMNLIWLGKTIPLIYKRGFISVINDSFDAWGFIAPVIYILIWFFVPRIAAAQYKEKTKEIDAKNKKGRRILTAIVALVLLALAVAIVLDEVSFGPAIQPFVETDLEKASITCVQRGRESEFEASLLGIFYNDGVHDLIATSDLLYTRSAPQDPEEYLLIRLVHKSGQEREIRMFTDGGYLYVTEEGAGAWRVRETKRAGRSGIDLYRYVYLESAIGQAFPERNGGAAGIPDSVLSAQRQRYNQSGKAVWFQKGTGMAQDFLMYTSNIPAEYQPHSIEDIRFFFTNRTEANYIVVYDVFTGEQNKIEKTSSNYEDLVAAYIAGAPQ